MTLNRWYVQGTKSLQFTVIINHKKTVYDPSVAFWDSVQGLRHSILGCLHWFNSRQ